MENFTPLTALLGGSLLGIGAALLLLGLGRIAGISGMLGSLIQAGSSGRLPWQFSFLLGLIAMPALLHIWILAPWTEALRDGFDLPLVQIALGGLLVGFGTRLGSGCTSGHGVCGIARLSTRSIVATLVFMAVAAVTVFFVH